MKKVDDEILLQMLHSGTEQKQIAAFFGCAPSYITKRKKYLQLQNIVMPESFAALTQQQQKFVLAKVSGKTNVAACQDAYETTSMESAKALGSNMMKNPDIQASIAELMDMHGLTKDARIKQLSTLVYHKDGNLSLKALDQSWKLDGSYAPEQRQIDVNVLVDVLEAIRDRQRDKGNHPLRVIEE
jgi:hypothetical protein